LLVDLYVRFHDEAEIDKTLEDEARASFSKLEKKEEKVCRLCSFKSVCRIQEVEVG